MRVSVCGCVCPEMGMAESQKAGKLGSGGPPEAESFFSELKV